MGSLGQRPTLGPQNNVVVKVFGLRNIRAEVTRGTDPDSVLALAHCGLGIETGGTANLDGQEADKISKDKIGLKTENSK